ncbi:MAG: dihydroorotate dehydrogenase, partial [Acidimicrobiales bacterium]|nr:dihydroorotate dehydrogenase [Acidimicrobiales bacterium]
VGTVHLANPVLTASGTSGFGAELGPYLELGGLGAVVTKSVSAEPWPGNPAPRLQPTPAGMLNSVGLQGPGVEQWLEHDLPALLATGARVVASIWGRRVGEFAKAAAMLADAPPAVVAVEVNLSCPNVEDRRQMFAHSPGATREAVDATASCRRPRWAKLSPNVADLCPIVEASLGGGAEAVTLVNTVLGMALDTEARRPALGAGGGGLSGPAIRPVAVRAVFDVRAAFPGAAIVGVGGVSGGEDAVALLLAGANAVQVGTATFADPRAPARVLEELVRWCEGHGVRSIGELVGGAHEHGGGAEGASSPGHPER